LDDLKKVRDALGADTYPEVHAQRTHTVNATFGPGPEAEPAVSTSEQTGFLFKNAAQTFVVQAQRGGFTFSRLAPYKDWDDLIAGARVAWDKYVQVALPRCVTRIAVRTINQIQLPLPSGDLRDWIRIVPDMPSGLPQALSEMFLRFVVPVPEEQATAIITQAFPVTSLTPERLTVILDIDVFRQARVAADDQVWAALNPLRRLKNNFFFECVTPQALELFK